MTAKIVLLLKFAFTSKNGSLRRSNYCGPPWGELLPKEERSFIKYVVVILNIIASCTRNYT